VEWGGERCTWHFTRVEMRERRLEALELLEFSNTDFTTK
jgi:hypothetical protein